MNMINKACLAVGLMLMWITSANAQTMTLNQVIDQVLQHNFDAQVAKQDVEIANNNSTKGNAGLLPSVQLSSGANYSNNSTKIKFAGGIDPINVDGAQNTSYNGSIGATYTIFNGFARVKTYQKLQLMEDMSEEQLRLTLENAIITSIGLYLDLAKLQDDFAALEENLRLSRVRLSRVQMARTLGSSTSLNLSNAELDYHTDSVAVLTLQNQIGTMQRQLNYLMGADIQQQIVVSMDEDDRMIFDINEVLNLAKSNSTALILSELRKKSADLDVDIAKANAMPLVNFNTSYGFNNSQNAVGIVLEQNNLGFNSGINVTIPLFNGGKIKTAMANAEVSMAKSELLQQQNSLSIEKEVYDHWYNYNHQLKIEALEKQNLDVAIKNEERSAESLKLGQITSIEYRQAQLALLSARNRLIAAKYNSKKESYHLLRLQGKLLNNN